MAKTLNLYDRENSLISSGEKEVVITGIAANTQVAKGDFLVSWSDENKESNKVEVPAFKTLPVEVVSVTLSKTTSALNVGSKETLTADILPANATDKTGTWSTNSSEIVSVINGEVTGVAEGSGEITFTTNDGNKKAKCSYTITAQ